MKENDLNYLHLIRSAFKDVMRKALLFHVEKSESHPTNTQMYHLTLLLETQHPGLKIPPYLVKQHPKEITLVLQHEFWDVHVKRQTFSVLLSFSGKPSKVVIPFDAIIQWTDHNEGVSLSLPSLSDGDTPQNYIDSGIERITAHASTQKGQSHGNAKVFHLKDFQLNKPKLPH